MDMGMDQYLLIPFLVGWTSIYQLIWCSPGVQGFDPSPYLVTIPGTHRDLQVSEGTAESRHRSRRSRCRWWRSRGWRRRRWQVKEQEDGQMKRQPSQHIGHAGTVAPTIHGAVAKAQAPLGAPNKGEKKWAREKKKNKDLRPTSNVNSWGWSGTM